jgi:hypothetical protein
MKWKITQFIQTDVREYICGSQGGECQNCDILTPRDFLCG